MRKEFVEGVDYTFINPASDPHSVHIKLIGGDYDDTIFKYGKVQIEEKDDNAYLLFGYDVIESSYMKPKKLEKNEDFKNYIGDLLVGIMAGNLEQEFIDENRTTDTDESDSQ